jgi:hypothetical protein
MKKQLVLCILSLFACTAVEPDGEGVVVQASTVALPPIQDTWIMVTPSGATADFGKSCQLRTSTLSATTRNYLLVQFQALSAVQCATLSNATLQLRTAPPLPSPGFAPRAFRIVDPWVAGGTGAANCQTCEVSSGTRNPIALPAFTDPAGATGPTASCAYFPWNVTTIVQHWCANPGSDHGILLVGPQSSTASVLNFHSMEAPAGGRPQLVITF